MKTKRYDAEPTGGPMQERIQDLIRDLSDREPKTRSEAVEVLVSLGELVVQPLVAALPDDSLDLEALFKVLRDIGEPAVTPLVAGLADNSDPKLQQRAAHALGQLNDLRAVEPLIAALKDDDAPVREEAVLALRSLADPRAVEPLLEMLNAADPGMRSKIAWALGDFGDARVVKPLVRLMDDSEPQVRRGAAWSLGKLGGDEAMAALKTALTDADREVKNLASKAIERLQQAGSSPSPEAQAGYVTEEVGRIIRRVERPVDEMTSIDDMRHSNPKVRIRVIEYIIQQGGTQNIGLLLTALDDININVRNAVIDNLIKIGAPAVEPLINTLNSKNRVLRAEAARTLGQIGDRRAVKPLIFALTDSALQVRIQAAVALGKLGDPAAVPPLIDTMADPEEPVRIAAAGALSQLGSNPASLPVKLREWLGRWRGWRASRQEKKQPGRH